jgi:hypothetical protein
MSGTIVLRLCIFIAIFSAIFSAIIFIQLPLAACAADGNVKEAWILTQRHDQSGEFVIYVAPDAVKIVCPANGGNVLAKGPDWKVVCFRPDDKIQWTTSLNKFEGLFTAVSISEAARIHGAPNLTRLGGGTYQGIRYSSYTDKLHRLFWLADGIKTSPQVAEVIGRYFSLPETRQILLLLKGETLAKIAKAQAPMGHAIGQQPWSIKSLMGQPAVHKGGPQFETESVKKIAYNAADFEYPKNFRPVQALSEVLFSKTQKSDLTDIINDLGFTLDTKAKSGDSK